VFPAKMKVIVARMQRKRNPGSGATNFLLREANAPHAARVEYGVIGSTKARISLTLHPGYSLMGDLVFRDPFFANDAVCTSPHPTLAHVMGFFPAVALEQVASQDLGS
jgi:hypothetical protein